MQIRSRNRGEEDCAGGDTGFMEWGKKVGLAELDVEDGLPCDDKQNKD